MSSIKWRPIKKNLNAYESKAIEQAIRKGLIEVGRSIEKDFQSTVRTWNPGGTDGKPIPGGIPKFRVLGPATVDGAEAILVSTKHSVYYYLNFGTKAHPIKPRNARVLRFRTKGRGSYRPKTHQGKLSSTTGGPVGPWVYSMGHQHPGNWGRGWDITITETTSKRGQLSKVINAEIRNALGSTGQAVRVRR